MIKRIAYFMTMERSVASSPCLSTLLKAMAMDCGEIILPAATPSEFKPTSQYILECRDWAALDCTAPNRTPELVPDPVTNVPRQPSHGAKNG